MITRADWNADLYLRFEDERTRPSIDLIQRVKLEAPSRCIDLGCGPGNSTELVAARFPGAVTEGLDSSPGMIEKARKRLPNLKFELADLESWSAAHPYDLIFANAVLQWIPDHARLFARLAEGLSPGGVLAVQMPNNLSEPSHVSMAEVAADSPWAERLADAGKAKPRSAHSPITAAGSRKSGATPISGRRPTFTRWRTTRPSSTGS